jgi:hypothetical protein
MRQSRRRRLENPVQELSLHDGRPHRLRTSPIASPSAVHAIARIAILGHCKDVCGRRISRLYGKPWFVAGAFG